MAKNRVNISHTLTKLSTNRYRIDITVGRVALATFNEFGIRCMAYIGGTGHHLGTFTFPQNRNTVEPRTSYSYDFTVTSTVKVWAAYECTHCNGTGSNEGWWGSTETSASTAVYENPINSIQTPTIKCTNEYGSSGRYVIGEDHILRAELSTVPQANGEPIRYVMYAQYNNGGTWVTAGDVNNCILYSTDTNKVSHNLSSLKLQRGTQIKIWGRAQDSKTQSPTVGPIENIYTNRIPTTPDIICTDKTFAGRHIVEDKVNIQLTKESVDPDGISVSQLYCGKYNDDGGEVWKSLGPSESDYTIGGYANSFTLDVTKYPRGTRFNIWAIGKDNFGAFSNIDNAINTIYRNQKPNKIPHFSFPEPGLIKSDTINLEWPYAGDPDPAQMITYKLEYKVNNGSYQTIANKLSSCKYNFNISEYNPNDVFKFRVTPNDGMVDGPSTESENYIKDFSDLISWKFPIDKSTVYQNNPRCCIQCPNGDYVAYVSFDGGNSYVNSETNSSKFVVKVTGTVKTFLFRAENLKKGGNIIYYYIQSRLNGSTSNLNKMSVVIDYDNIVFSESFNQKNNILNEHYNTLHTATNAARIAYNFAQIDILQAIKRETIITAETLNKLISYINNIRVMINKYTLSSSSSLYVNTTTKEITIGKNVTISDFNIIKQEIENL